MSPAVLSVAALIVAILVSCFSPINVGFLAIVFAGLIGTTAAGMRLEQVMAGFPGQLFLTLVGVTLLFGQAQANGTLERVTAVAVRLCRGSRGAIALMFFAVTMGLSAIGPGNIASAALVAPLAMSTAGQVGIPALLMAIMVGNGASGGSLSPIAPAGIVANGIMARAGLGGHELYVFLTNAIAHTAVALAGFLVLGGWRLFRQPETATTAAAGLVERPDVPDAPDHRGLHAVHRLTLLILAVVIVAVVGFQVNVGMAAFSGAVVISVLGLADENDALRRVPWRVILMVTGVTVLISVLEKTGGLDLFVALLARIATRDTVEPVIAFVTGAVSLYSSTSGVVLPALLPTVPGLVERLGGGDPLAIACSINIGGHLVDVSPLSTIGALCLAAAPAAESGPALFNKLLAWGVSMTIVGAAMCWGMF